MSSALHFVIDTLWFTAKDLCTSSQSFNDQCWYRLKYHRIWQNGTLQKEHNTWWICWSSSSLHVVWGVAKLLYWDLRNTKLYNFFVLYIHSSSSIWANINKRKRNETTDQVQCECDVYLSYGVVLRLRKLHSHWLIAVILRHGYLNF